MKTTMTKSMQCLLTLIFIASFSILGYSQTLTTDSADYHPGETVYITGTGFAPNETVTMQVTHVDLTPPDTGDAHVPWDITADGNGNIATTWIVDPDAVGELLRANADGQTSMLHAQADFTDSDVGSACISNVISENGGCVVSTMDGPNQVWDIQAGGIYTVTLSNATDVGNGGTDITIYVNVINSNNGNTCNIPATRAPGFPPFTYGPGVYSFEFEMPDNACYTYPVRYGVTDCNGSSGLSTLAANCLNSGHLRAALFDGTCNKTANDEDCSAITCIPPSITSTCVGGNLGCNPTLPPAIATPTFEGTNAIATYADAAPVSTGGCGWSITRTWTVNGDCGSASCSQTYTYQTASALSFDNLPTGGALGCNPATLPSCTPSVNLGNLVTNGDFEGGNSAFMSQYVYQSNLYPEGTFYIGANANTYHGGFTGLGHNGNFMIVNGAGTANTIVWEQTVTVTPNTNYYFSTWVSNVDGNPMADLQFSINGSQIGGIFNPVYGPGVWTQFYQTWNSGANTSALLRILDQNTTLGGNDFGVDDVVFGLVAPGPVTATNACGTVNASCSAGTIVENGCTRSQTIHYHASASCGADADADVVYSWSVSSNLTVAADGPTSVCEGECIILTATSGFASYQWYLNGDPIEDATGESLEICYVGTGNYTVSVTNTCGCGSTSAPITVSIHPTPACGIDPLQYDATGNGGNNNGNWDEAELPVANSTGNSIVATYIAEAGSTLLWSSSNLSWPVTGGQGTAHIYFTAGPIGTSATFTLTITSPFGCISTCDISFTTEVHEQCAYTQGFYGNTNGQMTCIGLTAVPAIKQSLGCNYPCPTTGATPFATCNPIVVGTGSRKVTVPCNSNSASCLNSRMPSSGSPGALPAAADICNATGNTWLNNQNRLKNTLLGQAITLNLNMRLFPGLGNLHITTASFTTYGRVPGDCDPNSTSFVLNNVVTKTIPQCVINCLGGATQPLNNTVTKLRDLANRALGYTGNGNPTCAVLQCTGSCTPPTFADITAALTAINEGFDACRFMSGFNVRMDNVSEALINGESALVVYPNPAKGVTSVEFLASSNSNATVDIYSINGSLVSNLFNENVTEGSAYKVNFNTISLPAGIYFVRLTVGDESAVSKLVVMNHEE